MVPDPKQLDWSVESYSELIAPTAKLREDYVHKIDSARVEHDLNTDDCERLFCILELPSEHWERHFEAELSRLIEFRKLPPAGRPSKEMLQRLRERRKAKQ